MDSSSTGTYTIEVYGAEGGGSSGGKGAKMVGDFSLDEDDIIHILLANKVLPVAQCPQEVVEVMWSSKVGPVTHLRHIQYLLRPNNSWWGGGSSNSSTVTQNGTSSNNGQTGYGGWRNGRSGGSSGNGGTGTEGGGGGGGGGGFSGDGSGYSGGKFSKWWNWWGTNGRK